MPKLHVGQSPAPDWAKVPAAVPMSSGGSWQRCQGAAAQGFKQWDSDEAVTCPVVGVAQVGLTSVAPGKQKGVEVGVSTVWGHRCGDKGWSSLLLVQYLTCAQTFLAFGQHDQRNPTCTPAPWLLPCCRFCCDSLPKSPSEEAFAVDLVLLTKTSGESSPWEHAQLWACAGPASSELQPANGACKHQPAHVLGDLVLRGC